MPRISLGLADAAELAEMLTFLADWLTSSQKQAIADSLTAFVGHPAYDTDGLVPAGFTDVSITTSHELAGHALRDHSGCYAVNGLLLRLA